MMLQAQLISMGIGENAVRKGSAMGLGPCKNYLGMHNSPCYPRSTIGQMVRPPKIVPSISMSCQAKRASLAVNNSGAEAACAWCRGGW